MKQIPRPKLDSATVMRAPDLNGVRFAGDHTVLTPGRLDSLAAEKTKAVRDGHKY